MKTLTTMLTEALCGSTTINEGSQTTYSIIKNSKTPPALYGGEDWVELCNNLNSDIEFINLIPTINNIIKTASDIMPKLKNADNGSSAVRKTISALKLMPQEPIDAAKFYANEQYTSAAKFNELNNELLKNKGFCEFAKNGVFSCSIYYRQMGKSYGQFTWDFSFNKKKTPEELKNEFESLNLKLPKGFIIDSSFTNGHSAVMIVLTQK